MNSFELILPFLRPIEHLILDDEISEVMVNGGGRVFVEREGLMREEEGSRSGSGICRPPSGISPGCWATRLTSGRRCSIPGLPDGSRVAAAMPPASVGGTVLDIRKFRARRFTAADLVDRGMLTAECWLGWCGVIQEERGTILISGGTGTGKTSC